MQDDLIPRQYHPRQGCTFMGTKEKVVKPSKTKEHASVKARLMTAPHPRTGL